MTVGAIAGLSAGLFGIGGGAVMVPALYFAFHGLGVPEDIVMHCAVATSSAVIIANSVRSVRRHNAYGAVDWDLLWPQNLLKSYGLWIGMGAFWAAIWLAPQISGRSLTILFAFISFFVAMQFIFGRPNWVLWDKVPGGLARPFVGGGVGILSSLIGIGGGSLTVPLMSLCGVPIHRAVGTASGFGFAIAVPATLGFIVSGIGVPERPVFSLGYVNLLGCVLVAVIAYITIPYGVKLAHNLSQKRLKICFGLCLIIISANMARKALGY